VNRNRKIVLWLGVAVFVLISLFPPVRGETKAFAFLLNVSSEQIQFEKLAIQWAITVAITAVITLMHRTKRSDTGVEKVRISLGKGIRRLMVLASMAILIVPLIYTVVSLLTQGTDRLGLIAGNAAKTGLALVGIIWLPYCVFDLLVRPLLQWLFRGFAGS
jgi:hypothetical protein